RPGLTAPDTTGVGNEEKRVAPPHRRRTEVGEEVIPVREELPRRLVAGVGEAELPGHIADQLAALRAAGVLAGLVGQAQRLDDLAVLLLVLLRHVKEEVALRVPELLLQVLLEPGGPVAVGAGGLPAAGQFGRAGDGQGVGPEVAVEGRPVAGRAA